MRRASPTALAAAVLFGMAAMTATVMAQSVPLPRPAPKPSTASTPTPTPPSPGKPIPLATGEPVPVPNVPIGKLADAVPGQSGTVAFDQRQRGMIERVNLYLMSVQMMAGDFVQVAPNGSKSEGKFYLQKPGRMRFEYDPPSPIELIADGQSLVVRDRKLATQDLYPLSQTPLRFLLADRIDLLKDTNVVAVMSDDLFVTVIIEEKQVLGGTHRLVLMFNTQDLQLRQWTVTDPQGYNTTVAIFNIDTPKKLDPDLFKINYERMQ